MLTLGVDTSNYATSLAVVCTDTKEVVCDSKRFLPVKEGQRGLRQSDAVFHHAAALPEMLEELKPYAVFIATGSVEAIPPLPGIGGEGVIPVRSYLCERPEIKDSKVIVLGAGQTGLETARMLAVAGNEVTVVDMLPDEIPPITDHRLDLNYAREAGVKILMAHKVVRIEDSAVVVTDLVTGEEKSLPRDKVIVALGVKSDRALYDEVKDRFQNVFNLGDSDKPGMAVYAVSAGYLAAANLPAKDYVVDEVYFSDIDYRK